jgi:hypothetical protein
MGTRPLTLGKVCIEGGAIFIKVSQNGKATVKTGTPTFAPRSRTPHSQSPLLNRVTSGSYYPEMTLLSKHAFDFIPSTGAGFNDAWS